MNEHKVSLEYFYKIVRSSALGLSDEKASLRLAQYGKNILVQKKRYQLIFKFLRQFTNFFAILLILGGLLAFLAEYLSPGMGNLYIGIALLVVVVLNALFTFIQEYQSEQILESFKKMLPQQVTVIRNGEEKQLEAAELTVGDVFLLQEGDKVPADGRLIEEHQLKIDLSSITGESEPELRKLECTHEHILESRNMVFSGTTVQSGNGKAVVYATGMHTEIGRIISLTRQSEKEANPLHKEISRFIRIISIIAIVLGSVFFALSILLGQLLIGSIIFAIGIIVANVPEGLLPTVTLCLTIASKRMAKKNALIKNLESVETLGSTTVICTDKTGTLTQNKMSLASLFVDGMFINVDRPLCKSQAFQKLILNMSLCNNSKYTSRGLSGDPTETALLAYAQKFLGKKNISSYPRIHESPFDSKTKRMISTCIVEGRKIAFMKGAPEVILEKCSRILVGSSTRMLTADEKNKLTQTYCSLASRGERVLGFGYKQTSTAKVKEDHFIFLGLVGLTDPPRKEVKEAIRKATSAGIRVIMITGDHTLTAESIAQKIGLINGKPNMVTGDQLKNMPQKRFRSILQKENLIFARTNPFQKLQIVRALKELGEIVTVTGDGVNDAPALKHADMGVSMGISGTEVAREASDMVLMDDNFATIVNAIEEGRTIFDNIKKFIAYILTSNVPQILPFIAFVLLGIPLPLTIVLILAIDLGTDLLPALGLGNEAPEEDVMRKKPRGKNEKLLTKNLLIRSYGIIGVLQAAAGFCSYFFVLYNGGWVWGQSLSFQNPLYQKAVTAFFASVIICQVADVLICRTRRQSIFRKGFFTNKLLYWGIISELLILAVIVYLPFTHSFFGTAPLSLFELLLSVPFALIIFFGDEVRKIYIRRKNKFFIKYLTW